MQITPKHLLRVDGELIYPGRPAEVNEAIAKKLLAAGMVETATLKPPEQATLAELRAECKRKGLAIRGSKKDLLKRLRGD